MKKILFIAALISALCLSSCSDDDRYYDSDRSERTGNNGRDNGGDNGNNETDVDPETFEVSTGVDGTGMSYVSWIEIDGKRQTVNLNANAVNLNKEVEVSSFVLGNLDSYIKYGIKNSSRNGNITVVDSLMQFFIVYDNVHFSYDMFFQTARYDDGKVRQRMASLRFSEDVKVNNPTVTDLSAQVIDGYVYARKLLRHSIKVTFNGVEVSVTANITMKRKLGLKGEVSVVDSELHSSGIKDIRRDGKSTYYTSWIKVKQTDIDGAVGYKTYELLMFGSLELKSLSNTVTSTDISKISDGFDISSDHTMNVGRDRYIIQHYTYRVYVVKYNQFTAKADIKISTAVYDDGISTIEFPYYNAENIKDSYTMKHVKTYTDAHGSYKEYLFTFNLSCKYGNQTHTESESFDVILMQ